MAAALITTVFTTKSTLYAVVFRISDGYVWNTSTGAFEAFSSSNWANYAIAMTETTGTGFFSAAYPSAISETLTAEAVYQQAGGSPATSDTVQSLVHSQGQNVPAVGGSATAAAKQQAALDSMITGTVQAGAISATAFPTSLTDTSNNIYTGRLLVMTSGNAIRCVAQITGYTASGNVLAFTPLAVTPAAGDAFIII